MEGMQHMLESYLGPTGYFKKMSDSASLMEMAMNAMGLQPPPMAPEAPYQEQDIRNKRNVDQSRMENIIENVKSVSFWDKRVYANCL